MPDEWGFSVFGHLLGLDSEMAVAIDNHLIFIPLKIFLSTELDLQISIQNLSKLVQTHLPKSPHPMGGEGTETRSKLPPILPKRRGSG